MQYFLILLTVSILPIVGFVIGTRLGRESNLTRHERRELEARRNFMSDLGAKAGEHVMLGDDFAVIVQGMLHDERKKLR